MITLQVLETNKTENELFMMLVERGRHADIPYYWSVEEISTEKGWVTFIRLDTAPSPEFRVGVAGNLIVVSVKDLHVVKSMLCERDVAERLRDTIIASSADEAQQKFAELRKETEPKGGRGQLLNELKESILRHNSLVDASLLKQ